MIRLTLLILAFTLLTAALAVSKERGLRATNAALWVIAVLAVMATVMVLQP
jgi:hypothetical protein